MSLCGLRDGPNVEEVKLKRVRVHSGYAGRLQGGQSGSLQQQVHFYCMVFTCPVYHCLLCCSYESDWLFLAPCVYNVSVSPRCSLGLCRRRQRALLKVWFAPLRLQLITKAHPIYDL